MARCNLIRIYAVHVQCRFILIQLMIMKIFSLLGDFRMESINSSASMEAMMGFSGFGECSLIVLLHVHGYHLDSCLQNTQ